MDEYPFQFKPGYRGLRAILGGLETEIMKLVWEKGPLTVREAHRAIQINRKIAYTTVMTVMSRLAEKGLLLKEREGQAFRYRPSVSEDAFKKNALGRIMRALLGGFGAPAISQFVDTVGEDDPEKIEELARLIEEKRSKKRG